MQRSVHPDSQHPSVFLTATEAEAHQAELERLKRFTDRHLLAPAGARTPTGLRDAEELGREHALTVARIVELESLLRTATVLEPGAPPTVVAVGVDVDVHYARADRTASYHVSAAALPSPGSVTAHSPLGLALMGHAVGDHVDVELPGGRREHVQILSLRILGDRRGTGPGRATGAGTGHATRYKAAQ